MSTNVSIKCNPKWKNFKIGDRVRVTSRMVDFHFYNGDTGVIIRKPIKESYLSIIVKFDEERVYKDGHIEKQWNFNTEDLEKLECCPTCNKIL